MPTMIAAERTRHTQAHSHTHSHTHSEPQQTEANTKTPQRDVHVERCARHQWFYSFVLYCWDVQSFYAGLPVISSIRKRWRRARIMRAHTANAAHLRHACICVWFFLPVAAMIIVCTHVCQTRTQSENICSAQRANERSITLMRLTRVLCVCI